MVNLAGNACFRCCCGVACAGCWIAIGIWAFFFLGILGLLFSIGKQGNVGHFKAEDAHKHGTNLLITWAIYVVVTVLCGFNLYYRIGHPFPEITDATEGKEEFSAIGPMGPTENFVEGPLAV